VLFLEVDVFYWIMHGFKSIENGEMSLFGG